MNLRNKSDPIIIIKVANNNKRLGSEPSIGRAAAVVQIVINVLRRFVILHCMRFAMVH